MARLDDVRARIKYLKALRADELKSGYPSKVYIEDLDLSIQFANEELKSIGKPLDIINGAA